MKFIIGEHEVEIDLSSHKRKKGLNNISLSVLKDIQTKTGVTRLSSTDKEEWLNQIRSTLIR